MGRARYKIVYSYRYVCQPYEYDLQQLELIMCQLTGIDPLAPVPPYRQMAEILKRRILSGQYPPTAVSRPRAS